MSIPEEFKDYMAVTLSTPDTEQTKKFTNMHLQEIKERACLLRNLGHDKRETKKRVKQNIRWEFESTNLPSFYNSIDKIVDTVYAAKAPTGW